MGKEHTEKIILLLHFTTVLFAGWVPQVRITNIHAMEPFIAIDKDGRIWVSFTSLYSGVPDPVFVTYSYDGTS